MAEEDTDTNERSQGFLRTLIGEKKEEETKVDVVFEQATYDFERND
eukprot:CAMPEP_0194130038 /NCGR_PEP_ID=MMETSP0152-20130528/1206_1 /TAXON_ID=1049557 /ORGANISM="Thalassiothrix antarctica, Strain L6-D1" /LENGTH=45 /DNA_ID= /DNA_START= /DNA_END= /DNA_ORIENTATION=